MPGAITTKPGSATLPFFGVVPALLDTEGRHLEVGNEREITCVRTWIVKSIQGPSEGNMCFSRPWPGMMRTVWGDHDRFVSTYFKAFPGHYFTGDGARRDKDGYYWITGRVDDLMNVRHFIKFQI